MGEATDSEQPPGMPRVSGSDLHGRRQGASAGSTAVPARPAASHWPHPLDLDQQVLRAAQQGTRPVGGRVHDQARLLQPPQEFGERDLRLGARQRRAKAAMDATAKPQVLIVAPLGIEAVRVGEPCRVTIACGQRQRDHHTFGNRRPCQRNLGQGGPTGEGTGPAAS